MKGRRKSFVPFSGYLFWLVLGHATIAAGPGGHINVCRSIAAIAAAS
jgi:hypothetical protein